MSFVTLSLRVILRRTQSQVKAFLQGHSDLLLSTSFRQASRSLNYSKIFKWNRVQGRGREGMRLHPRAVKMSQATRTQSLLRVTRPWGDLQGTLR